jgi:hypothetical protein
MRACAHLHRAAAMVVALVGAYPTPARADAAPAWFADRPVAWYEHDRADLPRAPKANHLQELQATLLWRDTVAGEADRILSLDMNKPARDVNALDEVPCSTWFCPRNHLRPLSPAEAAAVPAETAPRLPLRIVKGKDEGTATGFQVKDANGRKFMLKLDPKGHPGLTTAAEIVGSRIFRDAGYNVPDSMVVDLRPEDLTVDPEATFMLYRVQRRPLTQSRVDRMLAGTARLPDGRLRAVLVPWIQGQIVGGFDMIGRRDDDLNDRIPHQDRRSLRASWVLFAWIGEMDPGSINSIDTYVAEGDRHLLRHYFLDFGSALGSGTAWAKGPHQTGEYYLEVGRTMKALLTLGFYRRPFQDQRDVWWQQTLAHPNVGWFQGEDFDPDTFRTNRRVPAHMRQTARDRYWGAKVVTSFSDEQIAAIVGATWLSAQDQAYVRAALRARRDIIGRRYLAAVAAVENPVVSADGASVCFDDLVIARGLARPEDASYDVRVEDGLGTTLTRPEAVRAGAEACVPLGGSAGATGYRIVRVATRWSTGPESPASVSRASRIHLRWRATEGRFVVVGLERDE